MRSIYLGKTKSGDSVRIPVKLMRRTHTIVTGSTGGGKSKTTEVAARQVITSGEFGCLVGDPHATTVQSLVEYCCELDIGLYKDFRKLVLLNPSDGMYYTPFNPFAHRAGTDPGVQVNHRVSAFLRAFGVVHGDSLPLLERNLRILFAYCVTTGESLINAVNLLHYENRKLREAALDQIADDRHLQAEWEEVVAIRSPKDWRDRFGSLQNRLSRILSLRSFTRFLGLPLPTFDFQKAMREGWAILVNLSPSERFDATAARVFGSWLLYELFEAAMRRATKTRRPKQFFVFLDEFQEFLTPDLVCMLNGVRKGGVHCWLSTQSLLQLQNSNPELVESILGNCKIKIVFSAGSHVSASQWANEIFLEDICQPRIKHRMYRSTHDYNEEQRIIRSTGNGWAFGANVNAGVSSGNTHTKSKSSSWSDTDSIVDGQTDAMGQGEGNYSGQSLVTPMEQGMVVPDYGSIVSSQSESTNSFKSKSLTHLDGVSHTEGRSVGESDSESDAVNFGMGINGSVHQNEGSAVVPFLRPVKRWELSSETFYTPEELRNRATLKIKNLEPRTCFVKLDTEPPLKVRIARVEDVALSKEIVADYERELYEAQAAISASDADELVAQKQSEFIGRLTNGRASLHSGPSANVISQSGNDDDSEFLR